MSISGVGIASDIAKARWIRRGYRRAGRHRKRRWCSWCWRETVAGPDVVVVVEVTGRLEVELLEELLLEIELLEREHTRGAAGGGATRGAAGSGVLEELLLLSIELLEAGYSKSCCCSRSKLLEAGYSKSCCYSRSSCWRRAHSKRRWSSRSPSSGESLSYSGHCWSWRVLELL